MCLHTHPFAGFGAVKWDLKGSAFKTDVEKKGNAFPENASSTGRSQWREGWQRPAPYSGSQRNWVFNGQREHLQVGLELLFNGR